jgi:alpha-pyrone synthase
MDKKQKIIIDNKVEAKDVFRAEDIAFSVKKNKKLPTAIINSIGSYYPSIEFDTSYFINKLKDKLSDNLIKQLLDLGIEKKHIGVDVEKLLDTGFFSIVNSNSDMAKNSVINTLKENNTAATDIDYLITVSDTSDFISPGLSNQLIYDCGFKNDIRHISISGMGCAGFLKALEVASDFLGSNPGKKALIVISVINSAYCQDINSVEKYYTIEEINSSETLKKDSEQHINNWLNIIQFFLFGDMATAAIVSGSTNSSGSQFKLVSTKHITNIRQEDYKMAYFPTGGSLYSNLDVRPRFFMHRNLPKTGLIYSKRLINTLEKNELESIQKWLVHTGSKKIIDIIKDGLKIDLQSIKESYEIIKNFGNITPCSLPLILKNIISDDSVDVNKNIAMLGFGNGFSASLTILKRVS